jgi:putative endonuclease
MSEAQTSYAKGVLAEKRAVAQLRLHGYKILKERYKTKFGEIDVIAQKGDLIAFIEVKAHQSVEASLYAVTPRTRKRIEQSALWFLSENPEYSDFGMRFDVMVFKGGGIWGEHLDNAWMVEA